MANNDAIFNAVIAGITGACQDRWLVKQNPSDYSQFKTVCLEIATLIDGKIETISDLNPASARMMQSICQGVFSSRYPQSLNSGDYNNVANAIVALWTQSSTPIDPAESALGGFSFSADKWEIWDDMHNESLSNSAERGGFGDTGWYFSDAGSATGLTTTSVSKTQCNGILDLDCPAGIGDSLVLRSPRSRNQVEAQRFRRFRANVGPRGDGYDDTQSRRFLMGLSPDFLLVSGDNYAMFWLEKIRFGANTWHVYTKGPDGENGPIDTGLQSLSVPADSSAPVMQILDLEQSSDGIWTFRIFQTSLETPDFEQSFISNVPDPEAVLSLGFATHKGNNGTSSTVYLDWAHVKCENYPRLGQVA